jgi:O-antigen/teichoic acid export membrane protein
MSPTEGRGRRITHNTLFLYGAEATSRLFSWALLAVLTRSWGEVGTYGQYALAVNWVSILAVFSELGLNVLVVREVAQDKKQALFYLRNAIAIRSAFSLVFWVLLIGISFALGYEPVLKIAMAVMGLRILLDSIAGGYVYLFQSHEMMGYYSLVNILGSVVRLAGILIVLAMGGGVVPACAVWTLASLAALVALAVRGLALGWKPDFSRFRLSEIPPVLRQSFPLAVFGSVQMLYYRVDSIILKSLSGNEAVGYYDLATKVLFVILAFSQIFGTAVFPVLSSVKKNTEDFGRLSAQSLKFLAWVGLPTAVGGFFLASPIIQLVSGPKYAASIPLFKVLAVSIFPYFLCHVYVIALAIHNSFRLNVQYFFLFILNAVLNFIFIPRWGALGSAWATVFCEILGMGLGFGLALPYLKKVPWAALARPLLACLGASGVLALGLWRDPRLYWIFLGPVVYGLGLWLLGGATQGDLRSLRSVFKRNPA